MPDLGAKVAERVRLTPWCNFQLTHTRARLQIDEYLATGHIAESEEILASDRFQTLELLASVYTIGNRKARELYNDWGCRTLEDLAEHYALKEAGEWDSGVVGEGIPSGYKGSGSSLRGNSARSGSTPKRRSRDAARRRKEGKMSAAEIVREWIGLKPDLDTKIPRAEVFEIETCVAAHLEALMPRCRYTVTGGYRRGKSESNDVDIVICPPADEVDEARLLRDLVTRMTDLGGSGASSCSHVLTPPQGSSHMFSVSWLNKTPSRC